MKKAKNSCYINTSKDELVLESIKQTVRKNEIKPLPYIIALVAALCSLIPMIVLFSTAEYENGVEDVSVSKLLDNFKYTYIFVPFTAIWLACVQRLMLLSGLVRSCSVWWTLNILANVAVTSFIMLAFVETVGNETHYYLAGVNAVCFLGVMVVVIVEYQVNQKRHLYDGNFIINVVLAVFLFVFVIIAVINFGLSFGHSFVLATIAEVLAAVVLIIFIFILARIAQNNLYGTYDMEIVQELKNKKRRQNKEFLWHLK
jgi:hypothetical protein